MGGSTLRVCKENKCVIDEATESSSYGLSLVGFVQNYSNLKKHNQPCADIGIVPPSAMQLSTALCNPNRNPDL